MANILDYQFNVGGNFTAAMDGMVDSSGRFSASIKDCNNWLGKLLNTLAVWNMANHLLRPSIQSVIL